MDCPRCFALVSNYRFTLNPPIYQLMTLGSRESIWDRIPGAGKALLAIAFPLVALLVVAGTPNRIVESDEQSKLAAIPPVEAVDGEERALNRGLLEAETAAYAYAMSGADE